MPNEPLNILHLSDLHISKDQALTQKRFLEPMLADIRRLTATPLGPSIIVFTGDLVHNADEPGAYELFFDEVIVPLLDATGLGPDRLVVVPGNHDARRSVVSKFLPFAKITDEFRNRDELNRFYADQKNENYFHDKFKTFQSLKSAIGNSNVVHENTVFSTYYVKDFDLSIIALNTAWFSKGGLEGNEKGLLAIPDQALYDARSSLPKSTNNVLLTHHPTSWLVDENAADLVAALDGNTFHLFGHVHEPTPEFRALVGRSIFTCQSGALYTGRSRYSGYSILSLAQDAPHAQICYRSYFERRQRYDAALDVTEDQGLFHFTEESKQYWHSRPKKISQSAVQAWIKSAVSRYIEDKLIDDFTRRPVNEVFVASRMSRSGDVEDDSSYKPLGQNKLIKWPEFVRSSANHVVRGRPEFGKTTMLKQLAFELATADETLPRARIPVFVSFRKIELGGNRFVSLLRSQLPECPEVGFTFTQLADDGYLCLLIDDVDFKDLAKIQELTRFMKEHPKNRFVLSALSDSQSPVGRVSSADFPVPIEALELEQFTRQGIRRVVENLFPGSKMEQEQLLNRIVHDLQAMNVPITAVNGAILLTVFQSDKTFVPVNRAIVLERFIDITLKRYAYDEPERSAFDSTNKSRLLAAIARWMCEAENYTVDYSQLNDFVTGWLRHRALNYNPHSILMETLNSRILSRHGNDISFTYRSFLEYFVAKEMQYDVNFKQWIMADSRYLSYVFDIEYYAGLDRGDLGVLDAIGYRFEQLTSATYGELNFSPDLNLFETILPSPVGKSFDILDVVEHQLKLPPLSEVERDEMLQMELPVDAGKRQEVYRPSYRNDAMRWFACLILYSRVFRNMEFISGDEKARHMRGLLRAWARFLTLFIFLIPNLVKHRSFFINGVKYEILAREEIEDEALARFLMMSAPRAISGLIFENLGSEKLAGTLSDEARFAGEPLISLFLRRCLYADLRLSGFIDVLNRTYEELRNLSYLSEALIWKMNYMYKRLFLDEHEDQAFRKILARVLALRSGARGRKLSEVESQELQHLEKSRLIEVLRRQSKE